MSGVKISNIVKRSISLSPMVNEWAEEMARDNGFGSNFSAFCADLIRRAKERETNSVPVLADKIVSAAISSIPAKPVSGPVSYKSKPKAQRRSKARHVGGLPKKAS